MEWCPRTRAQGLRGAEDEQEIRIMSPDFPVPRFPGSTTAVGGSAPCLKVASTNANGKKGQKVMKHSVDSGKSLRKWLIVVAVIVALVLFLGAFLPWLANPRHGPPTPLGRCAGNVSALLGAMEMYVEKNGGVFPEVTREQDWVKAITPYIDAPPEKNVFRCPEAPASADGGITDYEFNSALSGQKLEQVELWSPVPWVFRCKYACHTHHGKKVRSIVFVDHYGGPDAYAKEVAELHMKDVKYDFPDDADSTGEAPTRDSSRVRD